MENNTHKPWRIAIVGGGAAGCFAAIEIRRRLPLAEVTLFEAAPKLLAKVAVTGGGRCNLTNSFSEVRSMEAVYPRGARLMKRLFNVFDYKDAFRWFEKEGIRLTTQSDHCVFPVSQRAMEIVEMLQRRLHEGGVSVRTSCRVSKLDFDTAAPLPFTLHFSNERQQPMHFDCVLATTGGSPKAEGLGMYADLGIPIVPPAPSLFSLCINDASLTALMGTVVAHAAVRLPSAKLRAEGALLLTHWGMSGPAVLKLSSYAARILAEKDYCVPLAVNWLGDANEDDAAELLQTLASSHPQKQLSSVYPEVFNARLWQHLLHRAGLAPDRRWNEVGRKGFNKLVAMLTNDTYDVVGKNRFKDEFVTCGGVALSDIDSKTMASRTIPGLFFAGEVLDVDAITGGFNLQAAWTTGYAAAEGIAGWCRELPCTDE